MRTEARIFEVYVWCRVGLKVDLLLKVKETSKKASEVCFDDENNHVQREGTGHFIYGNHPHPHQSAGRSRMTALGNLKLLPLAWPLLSLQNTMIGLTLRHSGPLVV